MGRHLVIAALVAGSLIATGCTRVGPDFEQPDADVNTAWESFESDRIKPEPATSAEWWRAFDDPALNELIDIAYVENLSLEALFTLLSRCNPKVGVQSLQVGRAAGKWVV